MRTRYYILPVWGCVEPEPLIGPFKTYKGMSRRAAKVYANQNEGRDALFYVKVNPDGKPQVGAFKMSEFPER